MHNQIKQIVRLSSLAPLFAAGLLLSSSEVTALDQVTLATQDTSDTIDAMFESAIAQDLSAKLSQLDGIETTPVKIASTEQAEVEAFNAQLQTDNLGQVTSVSQLSDVQPTDWAFQALQSLVERYGCIAGYPDGTFRGNRSATRYELAAALNACLDNISDKFATKEDLETVKALQEEFQAELATLRGRVDGLEARVDTLEAQQFSTTTKLQADVVMLGQFGDVSGNYDIPTDGFSGMNEITAESRPSVLANVYMSFNTSFSGDDLLQTTLSFGNTGSDFFSTAQVGSTPDLPFEENQPLLNPGQNYFAGSSNNAFLYRLAYTFKPFEDLSLTVAPVFYPTDIIDANSYTSPFTGFSTWQNINNPLITPYIFNFLGGAGGGFNWNPDGGPFTARGAYVAVNATDATDNPALAGSQGLFGDPSQATVELEYADDFGSANNFAVRLQYSHTAAQGLEQDVIGVNAEATFGKFGIFGRYGYSFADAEGKVNPFPYSTADIGRFDAQTFQVGVGVNDLAVPGSLLAVSFGAPFLVSDSDIPDSGALFNGSRFINDENQYNIEAFYRIPVNDNISVTPIFSAILNPNNSSFNGNIYQGLIRTVFSF